jgi:hypothetical protein
MYILFEINLGIQIQLRTMEKSMNIRGHQFPQDCGENDQSDRCNDICRWDYGINTENIFWNRGRRIPSLISLREIGKILSHEFHIEGARLMKSSPVTLTKWNRSKNWRMDSFELTVVRRMGSQGERDQRPDGRRSGQASGAAGTPPAVSKNPLNVHLSQSYWVRFSCFCDWLGQPFL